MADIIVLKIAGMWKAAWDASGAGWVWKWVEYLVWLVRAVSTFNSIAWSGVWLWNKVLR